MMHTDSYIHPRPFTLELKQITANQWLERWLFVEQTMSRLMDELTVGVLSDAFFAIPDTDDRRLTAPEVMRLTAAEWLARWFEVRDIVLEFYHPIDAAFIITAIERGTGVQPRVLA